MGRLTNSVETPYQLCTPPGSMHQLGTTPAGYSESHSQSMITPAQLRAARAIVGWSREKLAEKSGVGMPTIRDFELNNTDSKQGTVNK
jgi:hypothetical protein